MLLQRRLEIREILDKTWRILALVGAPVARASPRAENSDVMSPPSEGDTMKRFAIAGFAMAALIAPAMAADMMPLPYKAPVPVMSWTGCYVGADAGAAWSAQDVANSAPSSLDQAGVVGTINGAGPVGGGYAGCNLQVAPAWVVGLEGDFSAAHLGGSANADNVLANGSPTTFGGIEWTSRLNWIATVRGRVGYVFGPDLMFFVTGGAAWGASNYRSFDVFAAGCPACGGTTFSETNTGYVAGLGFDCRGTTTGTISAVRPRPPG
jgi:outer membrane immunogenic protein